MAKFVIAPDTDSIIELVDEAGNVKGSIEAIDAVQLYGQAHEESKKLGKDITVVYVDLLGEATSVSVTKSQAITLFNFANDLLEDLKKKSCPLLSQFDSSELAQPD
jgi:hypothetical protein